MLSSWKVAHGRTRKHLVCPATPPIQLAFCLLLWVGSHHRFFPDSPEGWKILHIEMPLVRCTCRSVSWLLLENFRPAVHQMFDLSLSLCYTPVSVALSQLVSPPLHPSVWFAGAHPIVPFLEKDLGKYILETFYTLKSIFFYPHYWYLIWNFMLQSNFSGKFKEICLVSFTFIVGKCHFSSCFFM